MMIIPHLTQDRISIIHCPIPCSRSIVSRARAPNIRQSSESAVECGLDVGEGECGRVRGAYGCDGEPAVGRKVLVVGYSCFEEVNNFGMVLVHGPVAGDVEGGIAGSVFAELMAPKIAVGRALGYPVSVCPTISKTPNPLFTTTNASSN